jgi:hypothetical protein
VIEATKNRQHYTYIKLVFNLQGLGPLGLNLGVGMNDISICSSKSVAFRVVGFCPLKVAVGFCPLIGGGLIPVGIGSNVA